jgi:DNA adenine methylase
MAKIKKMYNYNLQSIFITSKGYFYKITSNQKKKRIGIEEFQYLEKNLKSNKVSNSAFLKRTDVKNLKPLLRWVGGKQRLAELISEKTPCNIKNFYDPFLGGGASLLIFLSLIKRTKIKISGNMYVSDLNGSVINFYLMLQKQPLKLYKFITLVENRFLKLTYNEKKIYYYFLRNKFNKIKKFDGLQHATLFYFLNRTCFGGIYRENKKGEFNVPYGNLKKIKLLDKNNFFEISYLIQKVIFKKQNFKTFSKNVVFNKDDFIYLDPPYFPTKVDSFTNYLSFGFDLKDHQYMFDWVLSLEKKVPFLLHNSYTKQLFDIFFCNSFVKNVVTLDNNLKFKKGIRKELIITNYKYNGFNK